MANETTGQLAASLEALGTYADLKLRRSAPIPSEIAEKMDAQLKHDRKLSWEPPLCGVIHV
jgi:acyl-CoA thioester hydrolase